jgi:hypothetical protein
LYIRIAGRLILIRISESLQNPFFPGTITSVSTIRFNRSGKRHVISFKSDTAPFSCLSVFHNI